MAIAVPSSLDAASLLLMRLHMSTSDASEKVLQSALKPFVRFLRFSAGAVSRSHAFWTVYNVVASNICFTTSGHVAAGGGGSAAVVRDGVAVVVGAGVVVAGAVVGDGVTVVVGAGVVVAAAQRGHHGQSMRERRCAGHEIASLLQSPTWAQSVLSGGSACAHAEQIMNQKAAAPGDHASMSSLLIKVREPEGCCGKY